MFELEENIPLDLKGISFSLFLALWGKKKNKKEMFSEVTSESNILPSDLDIILVSNLHLFLFSFCPSSSGSS